jgi:hypothetical protein
VADRKAFLLRIDPDVLDAIQRWANDDLRSVNGQIEFLLRRALQEARRPVAGGNGTPAARGPAGRAADGGPREC